MADDESGGASAGTVASAIGVGVLVILVLAAFAIAPVLAGLAVLGLAIWHSKLLAFMAGRGTASLQAAYKTGQATKELEDVARVLNAVDEPKEKP